MPAQHRFSLDTHLTQQGALIPRGIADELLQALVIALGQLRLNPPNAFANVPPQQTGEVMPGMPAHVAPMHDEMLLIISAQLHEALRHAFQATGVIFYLGGFPPAHCDFPSLVAFGPASQQRSCYYYTVMRPKSKNYFNKVELMHQWIYASNSRYAPGRLETKPEREARFQ